VVEAMDSHLDNMSFIAAEHTMNH